MKAIKIHESIRNIFLTTVLETLKLLFKAAVFVRKKLPPDLCVVSKQLKPPRYNLLKKTLSIPLGHSCKYDPHVDDSCNGFLAKASLDFGQQMFQMNFSGIPFAV